MNDNISTANQNPRRVLVIDDNPSIHEDIRSIFQTPDTLQLDTLTSQVLGRDTEPQQPDTTIPVRIDSAYQGREGLDAVVSALKRGEPYELAIVDMRMPPGWDGLETIERLWQADPSIQVVICTAFSDYQWSHINDRLGHRDSLLVLKKPFDAVEVAQMVYALTTKWRSAQALEAKNQRLIQAIGQLSEEIKRRSDTEQVLQHQVMHDALTSMPNRTYVTNQVERCVLKAKREPGYRFGLMFIDLDRFKYINDSLGHRAGDDLLVMVANRLQEARHLICTTPNVEDMVAARLGGDEFVVLLAGVENESALIEQSQSLHETLTGVYMVDGHEIPVQTSIGVVLCGSEYDDVGLVLRDADTALYAAKENGRARYALYDQAMHTRVARRMLLERELRHATERGQISLAYQPIVSLDHGRIIEFEALLRWSHPELGVISPAEFLPVAEETGQIIELGEWVLIRACEQYKHWVRNVPNLQDLIMSVNVSPVQFAVADFPKDVYAVIKQTGVDPSKIQLEVTETAIMSNRDRVIEQINQLADMGHPIAMDDFGKGHSSLACLHEMPFSILKIDQNFVKQIDIQGKYINTIKAVVEMSHNRNITVVAEGIETVAQLSQLQAVECDLGQGYLFSPAVSPKQAEDMLRFPPKWSDVTDLGEQNQAWIA